MKNDLSKKSTSTNQSHSIYNQHTQYNTSNISEWLATLENFIKSSILIISNSRKRYLNNTNNTNKPNHSSNRINSLIHSNVYKHLFTLLYSSLSNSKIE